jgi:hypothetical protein
VDLSRKSAVIRVSVFYARHAEFTAQGVHSAMARSTPTLQSFFRHEFTNAQVETVSNTVEHAMRFILWNIDGQHEVVVENNEPTGRMSISFRLRHLCREKFDVECS